MMLVVPFCHKDSWQAFKLLRWMGELSRRYTEAGYKRGLKEEKILLIANRIAYRQRLIYKIALEAARIFGEARLFVPKTEHEVGWPGSPNFMFARALEHMSEFFPEEDIFLLEPDAIPLFPDWFNRVKCEWDHRPKGTHFMGAKVKEGVSKLQAHMSGNAVYGRNWREHAPDLLTAPDKVPWDLWSSDSVVPKAHFTRLIQHKFRGAPIESLTDLDKDAVIYHQDKRGKLFELLGGENPPPEDDCMSEKYYFADNSNRAIKAGGYDFFFQKCDTLGGIWRGVYRTEKESEQAALASLTGQASSGVEEIDASEFERLTKKKVLRSRASNGLSNEPQLPVQIRESPAVVVASQESRVDAEPAPIENTQIIDDIESVLKLGPVAPFEPPGNKKKKPKMK